MRISILSLGAIALLSACSTIFPFHSTGSSAADVAPPEPTSLERAEARTEVIRTNAETFFATTYPAAQAAELPSSPAQFSGFVQLNGDIDDRNTIVGDLDLMVAYDAVSPVSGTAQDFIRNDGLVYDGKLDVGNSSIGPDAMMNASLTGTLVEDGGASIDVDVDMVGVFGVNSVDPTKIDGVIGTVDGSFTFGEISAPVEGGFIVME